MRRKLWVGAAVAAVAVFVGAYALSPVFAAQALIRAGKAGDAAALERLVDFPAFRASLKDELNQALALLAKELGYNEIYSALHDMCKDEARHGQALEGVRKRYFFK